MDDDDFITIVAEDLLVDRDDAERAIQATLEVLAERLSAGQARDLAAQLPPRVAAWLPPAAARIRSGSTSSCAASATGSASTTPPPSATRAPSSPRWPRR
jgi:uncharacterized protein (DUF2267 family)